MLKISRKYVEQIAAAASPKDLYEPVQNAIALELATIPPYLCAYFTLKADIDPGVSSIIYSIAYEEMLHMNLMCNLMVALGGAPSITGAAATLTYPGPLPMNIGSSLEVSLRKCCVDQIQKVFMEIEKPEKPLEFKVLTTYATIGEFYRALVVKIEDLGDKAFTGDPNRQITDLFGSKVMFPITNVATARKAILNVIVQQGEGTTLSPEDERGKIAHYYRFQQIVKGRKLKKIPTPPGWSFSGDEIKLESSKVWNMENDPKTDNYPKDTHARAKVDAFNSLYSSMLRSLDKAFNENPASMDEAIEAMRALPAAAAEVLILPSSEGADTQAGLPFEYVP